MAEVKIQGLDEVRRRLKALPKNMRNRELGKALRSGGRMIRNDAKSRVPTLTGLVLKNIVMRTSSGRRAGRNADVKVRIGVASDRSGRDSGTDAFYWIFQEFGTSKMPAHPFLRPAFESNKNEALNAITQSLKKGLIRQAKKK